MRGERVGLYLHERRATGVILRDRASLERFSVQGEEGPGALLRAELEARQVRARWVKVGLERRLVTVKVLELPPATGGSLTQMVGFELERHVPFPPEDMVFAFAELPAGRFAPRRVLVAACERRVVDGALRALEGLRQKPQRLTVACHELPGLLARPPRPRRAVWAHRQGGTTALLFLGSGQLRLSRSVEVADAPELVAAVQSTLSLLRWRDCEAIWVSGDGAADVLEAGALAGLSVEVSEPPYSAAARSMVEDLGTDEPGADLLALAVALGGGRPSLDLLPAELRPRSLSVGQVVTVAVVALTALLGLGALLVEDYRGQRYLEELTAAARALEPEVRTVEGIAADLARKRRVLAALESAEQASLSPLPFLRDLTEALPPEAWISALNLNKRGVEITGQAAAASQLIPLLEGLPWLERVEFTSPVTKARDKEQFRIRAAWEADAARRAVDNGAARPAGPARPGPGAQPVPVPGGRGPRVPVRPAPGGGG